MRQSMEKLGRFLHALGLDEEPMGIYYTDMTTKTWSMAQKKIFRSKKAWGEIKNDIAVR